ncbi:unnamed protein product, partial [Phaeothamnion confervicola]
AASTRARVVKGVGGVVAADPSLMLRPDVQDAVIRRFRDVSISVRQGAIEVVGELILGGGGYGCGGDIGSGPALLETYYPALMERLVDCGVSVRKSVVKILRAALKAWPTHPRRAHICQKLMERASVVKEEDTIRDQIRDTFHEVWFFEAEAGHAMATVVVGGGERDEMAAAPAAAAGAGVAGGSMTAKETLRASAVQLVEVVSGVGNTDWLVKLLEGLIFGPGEGDKARKDDAKRRAKATAHCQRLVDCLVTMLLAMDKGVCPLPPAWGPPPAQLVALVETLHVFCRAGPAFLAHHMESMYPYLAGQNGAAPKEEDIIVTTVAGMTYHVLPLLPQPVDRAVMGQVAGDLKKAVMRCSVPAVKAAVQCLVRLAIVGLRSPAPVHDLLRQFYNYLYRWQAHLGEREGGDLAAALAAARDSQKVRGSVRRGLIVIGCICQHYPFGDAADASDADGSGGGNAAVSATALLDEEVDGEDVELPAAAPVDAGAPRAVYEMLRWWLERADAETQCSALTGLAGLLSGAPRLALVAQRHGVVGRVLSASAVPPAVCRRALAALREVLLAEEARVESGAARESMVAAGVTAAARVGGDQDAESSAVGGVLQLHVATLLRRLLHPADEVRLEATLLVGTVLRQGLVNPLETVPHLLALQVSWKS